MAQKRVIPTSDGRLIEVTEGELRKPPPPPEPPKKKHKYRKWGRAKPGRALYGFRGDNHPRRKLPLIIPGYAEWFSSQGLGVKLKPVPCQINLAKGMTHEKAKKLIHKARVRAEEDMKKIREKIDLSDAAEEALTEVLTIMRSPGFVREKLQAAKTVLEWTMAKPVARSEVTLNAAEQWLERLTHDDTDES